MKKIKVLFSDIGGVILTNGWDKESRKRACEIFHLDFDEMNHRHEFIFNVYEIGRITLDQYLDTAVFYEPRDFSKKEFTDFMYAQSQQLPNMLPYLIKWKKAHPDIKVISINNEAQELNHYRIQKFQLHRFFDAYVSSCVAGMRKPDPGIFRLAVGIAQVDPDECIYFDDRKMLVDAAAKTGLNAFCHTNFEDTKKIIEKYIG
ncbi:MAG: HAD-IA family hydrolase [Chitinophagaceae bacterium]|nr:HAD-IA family hydrolase [Chitinophagaceae bacterium]